MDGTNVYKVTLLIVDHDDIGVGEVKAVIENTRYPNCCIHPKVMAIDVRLIPGEWDDRHPINLLSERDAEFTRMFDTSRATALELLAIVEKARGNAKEESDRDCYFLARGRDEACDEIKAALKELSDGRPIP